MKAIMFLLSFMFVSCVTANTESRELSGVNPKPLNEGDSISENPLKLVGGYEDCMDECTEANPGSDASCDCVCLPRSCNKIEVQNPIKLAADYDTCVKGCIDEGGGYVQCHRVCEE